MEDVKFTLISFFAEPVPSTRNNIIMLSVILLTKLVIWISRRNRNRRELLVKDAIILGLQNLIVQNYAIIAEKQAEIMLLERLRYIEKTRTKMYMETNKQLFDMNQRLLKQANTRNVDATMEHRRTMLSPIKQQTNPLTEPIKGRDPIKEQTYWNGDFAENLEEYVKQREDYFAKRTGKTFTVDAEVHPEKMEPIPENILEILNEARDGELIKDGEKITNENLARIMNSKIGNAWEAIKEESNELKEAFEKYKQYSTEFEDLVDEHVKKILYCVMLRV